MRYLSVLIATVILMLTTLVVGPRPRHRPNATPVVGADGGALYTFDSGEAGFFTKTYFYDTGRKSSPSMPSSPRSWPKPPSPLREQTDTRSPTWSSPTPTPTSSMAPPPSRRKGPRSSPRRPPPRPSLASTPTRRPASSGWACLPRRPIPQQATVDETFTDTHDARAERRQDRRAERAQPAGGQLHADGRLPPGAERADRRRSGPPQDACLAGRRHRRWAGHADDRGLDRRSAGAGDHGSPGPRSRLSTAGGASPRHFPKPSPRRSPISSKPTRSSATTSPGSVTEHPS